MHGGTTSCGWSRIGTIDRTIGRRSPRSVARCYDSSCDRSLHPTIDRTIGRRVPRSILRSVTGCHTSARTISHMQDATIDRTIGRRMQRLIVPSIAGRHDWSYDRSPRLIVQSVVERNNWSYIGRWSLPLVARFPPMTLAIDILQSFVIARPRVEVDGRMLPLLEIVANIADRSHLGPIATYRTIQKSYDPVWLWFKANINAISSDTH